MALDLVCDIIQGHGGNAKDRAERDPDNKAQHLAVMNTWLRLYREVRALVDSPPFLRFQRALNRNYDLGVAIDGLSAYTPRINNRGLEPSGEDFLNELAGVYEYAAEIADMDAEIEAMPYHASFDWQPATGAAPEPCRVAAKSEALVRHMLRMLGLKPEDVAVQRRTSRP